MNREQYVAKLRRAYQNQPREGDCPMRVCGRRAATRLGLCLECELGLVSGLARLLEEEGIRE